ncbi:hypothetical protein PGTUg99_018308 [Puccinia graminis f. sp. tritici]|uniref:Uncharacterized protein n=1 Tax=Puccinia graminis f. sp. tritici TaxID=56615 RepID=A0A5B0M859_PUCGR|nr:hypothetical protein PGTUg99_018308 [Puccinia graminis f. sp. tritici]
MHDDVMGSSGKPCPPAAPGFPSGGQNLPVSKTATDVLNHGEGIEGVGGVPSPTLSPSS